MDIQAEVKQDASLMPAAVDIQRQILFALRRVCHLSRPLGSLEGIREFPISWPLDRESGLAPQYLSGRMLAAGDLTASTCFKMGVADPNRCVVQVDNRLVPQVLCAVEKKGNTYRTSQGRAKGVSRIAHHTIDDEEKQEVMANVIETSYFAVMSLPEFSGAEFASCAIVLQIYPMTAAKEDVASRLWSMVYNSDSTCVSEGGSKFALQVSMKFKLRPRLYSEKDAVTWALSSLPELNGSGLLVKNENRDQLLGEGREGGYSSKGSM